MGLEKKHKEMNNLVTENESLKFEVNRLKANKADLRKQMGLLENSESDKVKAIEELAGIKESLKSQNKKQDELILKLECECKELKRKRKDKEELIQKMAGE